MASEVTYADLNLFSQSPFQSSSSPALPKDVCQGPHWHQFALKLGCAGIILFACAVIGLSVSVMFLSQKSSVEKCSMDVQEQHRSTQHDRNETTERPGPLKCPVNWHLLPEKCLFFSQAAKDWKNSSADCYIKESSLLLIQDEEELRLIQTRINSGGILYWIGLNYTSTKKAWKWINGSSLPSDVCSYIESIKLGDILLEQKWHQLDSVFISTFQALSSRLKIDGSSDRKSCASISKTKIFSEECQTENKWICQKELKLIRKSIS